MRTLLVLSLVMVALVAVARADAPHVAPHPPTTTAPPPATTTAPPPAPWRDLYHQGSLAYDAGRLDEALRDFQQARDLGGPPTLLYDIALTLDRLGRAAEAVTAYRQYLDASPDASNRDVVEARLAELTAPAPPTTTTTGPILTTVAPPRTTTTTVTSDSAYTATRPVVTTDHWEPQGPEWAASWVMLALTAATSVAAVVVWQDGIGRFHALQDLCDSPAGCTATDIDESPAHVNQDAANALLGVSIGLGAITVLTFIIEGVVTGNRMRFVRGDFARQDHSPHLSVGPMGFSLSGTF
jgi:tetratricopeptide (TPR) repeat protein